MTLKDLFTVSRSCLSWFVRQLFPPQCWFCATALPQQQTLLACEACLNDLPHLQPHCPICITSLPASINTSACGECLRQPPLYTQILARFPYQDPIPFIIKQLKFSKQLHWAPFLAYTWLNKFQPLLKKLPDYLIAMPLHPQREKTRGYNQAWQIASIISQYLNIPLWNSVQRHLMTQPQAQLKASARWKNVKHAFRVTASCAGLRFALIDDVVTSSATAQSLCKTLLQSGASRIDIWCMARAQSH